MMLFFVMILELFGFDEQYVKDIVSSKFKRGEYIHKEQPDCSIEVSLFEFKNLLILDKVVLLLKSNDVEKRLTYEKYEYQSMYDFSDNLNVIKKEIFANEDIKKHNVYLLVKIFDDRRYENYLEKFKQYDFFINSLREKVNELPNSKLFVNTYYNPVKLIDFSLHELNLKEYNFDILSRKEHNYFIVDSYRWENNYNYMMISSKEFSDKFIIDYFLKNKHNNENLEMITDCNTKNFVIEKIIVPLMRHFNLFTLNFMTTKMKLDIRHEAKNVEVEYIINLNKSILNDSTNSTFIYTIEKLNKWLSNCQTEGLIMRFIQILILVKSKVLEKVIGSILIRSDDDVLDFLVSYFADTKSITEGEKFFIQSSKSRFDLSIFVNIYFLEEIAKQVCSSDIIPFSDNVTNNRKFFMLLYIGFVRAYRNLNIIQLIRYFDFICYEEMKKLHLFVIDMNFKIKFSGKKHLIALIPENQQLN